MSPALPLPAGVECVFLDAGGTMLGPTPSFEGRFVAVAAEHGETIDEAVAEAAIVSVARDAVWPEDWTDPARQRGFWQGFYRQILGELGYRGDGEALAEALYRSFTDPAAYALFPDVRPALEALAARGLKLGVISNFEPWLRRVLELQGVDHLFSAMAISGALGVAKPAPGIFQAALEQAGVAAGAALHVGDDLIADVAAARAVGITPVLIDRRGRRRRPGTVHRVERLTELVDLVDLAGRER